MPIPVHARAVLGYRVWSRNGSELWSIGFGASLWTTVSEAHCNDHYHPAPNPICECGLYALHSIEMAISEQRLYQILSAAGRSFEDSVAVGAVCGAGRVEIHATGWRAERAQVLGLLGSDQDRLAAERYGVPIFSSPDALAAYAESFADPAPKEVIPSLSLKPRRGGWAADEIEF